MNRHGGGHGRRGARERSGAAIMMDVVPTAFATADELARGDLLRAPLRWPRPSALELALKVTPPKAAEAATALGLHTIGDLLEHLPRDRREARTVATLTPGEGATVVVEVRSIASRPVRRRGMKPLVEAVVADETGMMKATFFNQPWLARKYPKGTRLVLHGKLADRSAFRVEGHAPTAESTGGADAVAHYPATIGLSSTQILALVREHLDAAHDTVDPLPARMRRDRGLPDRAAALLAAHAGDLEGGRRRLAFDELLLAQLSLLRRRAQRRASGRAAPLDGTPELTTRWRDQLLPFELTGDQRAAIAVLDDELAQPRPMQRLLMGEVGSGKTVVALHAILRAVEHDAQAVFMAPTEVLAEQHFATLQALMPGETVRLALLTGSTTARRRADTLSKLATGELSFVVGTHALLEDDVCLHRLAVVVVDEQHRFGVRQRATLDAKAPEGLVPHVLHMTATPIPRTMALLRYGDLDITTLRELPKGRRPIATRLAATDGERASAYEQIRLELDAGRQAFVVCPLVEESEALAAKAATAEFERLRGGELADYRVALLHGQMRPRDKQATMAAFAAGATDVLVATTVVEVGVDVPNATVMLVEGAERFGISQLHQLRGRIGRGEHPSTCLLFGPKQSARLLALERHSDGFQLARIDLELRGEGEIAGTRQSGLAQFRVARLPEDEALAEVARAYAERLLEADPELEAAEHALLADALAAAYGEAQRQPLPA
ncbi:MAG TPA: ATP-dependent DNA helicase RecG [Solirubrobacteraceae bacterium]